MNNPSINKYAAKTGQIITKIPLKNETDAYIFSGNKSCDVFILKGKNIVGGKGYRGNSNALAQFLYETTLELQKNAKKGVSVIQEFIK